MNTITILPDTLKIKDDNVDIDCVVNGVGIHVHVWLSHLVNATYFPGSPTQKRTAWRNYIADRALETYNTGIQQGNPQNILDLSGPDIVK